ncbi:hypothetical protein [Mucilaginibacter segetis]|uniref:PliI/PliC-like inhibitor of I-type lysozyme n=1 Tax=Mucilaginibacter segetis TaxID=2793071 RepID=A0A934PSZ3_9SPHI|nr:hypothetical protein [Mucilaginibacter segetis]MBK0378957.1 hypothetical protein [Mucilaginibacter segetis]
MNAKYLPLLILFALITACNSKDNKAVTNVPVSVKNNGLMEPFRFHKAIEVSPGQTYDVVSWGRGSTDVGAFAILHSDSAGMKYTTTTGDLDGTISDVYNSDMDVDGNPEILIQSKGKDTINFTKIYAFEFDDNKAEKLNFPNLTSSQKAGYRGDDNFYIKDGKLIREFPIYDGNTKNAKPTGEKRQLEYGLRNNSFTVTQLSKDAEKQTADKPAQQTVKQATSVKKKITKKKSSTKKKRRRRG